MDQTQQIQRLTVQLEDAQREVIQLRMKCFLLSERHADKDYFDDNRKSISEFLASRPLRKSPETPARSIRTSSSASTIKASRLNFLKTRGGKQDSRSEKKSHKASGSSSPQSEVTESPTAGLPTRSRRRQNLSWGSDDPSSTTLIEESPKSAWAQRRMIDYDRIQPHILVSSKIGHIHGIYSDATWAVVKPAEYTADIDWLNERIRRVCKDAPLFQNICKPATPFLTPSVVASSSVAASSSAAVDEGDEDTLPRPGAFLEGVKSLFAETKRDLASFRRRYQQPIEAAELTAFPELFGTFSIRRPRHTLALPSSKSAVRAPPARPRATFRRCLACTNRATLLRDYPRPVPVRYHPTPASLARSQGSYMAPTLSSSRKAKTLPNTGE